MALLVVISILSVAVALAYERHWEEFWQLVPWATLVLSGLALVALVVRMSRTTIRIARIVAVLVLVAALLGIWRHFDHNYVTAVMDQDYADRWGEMPVVERVWTVDQRFRRPCAGARRRGPGSRGPDTLADHTGNQRQHPAREREGPARRLAVTGSAQAARTTMRCPAPVR